MSFVNLHVHSEYSLLDGLAKIPDLVTKAKQDGSPALALTDHGVMYGAIPFYQECVKQGVKPILGCEVYVTAGSRSDRMKTGTSTTAVLAARPAPGFVETPFVRDLTERGLSYIAAGYPVHFRGPSGSGKTTMAMHVANRLGRPVMLVCGDDEFGSSDLVGGQYGYRRRKVIDNFVHSVLKTEEDFAPRWVDNRLTVACREGLTLVYDEFTRSRPEANNVLLSILEEKPKSVTQHGFGVAGGVAGGVSALNWLPERDSGANWLGRMSPRNCYLEPIG